ncbi:protein VASP homolog [Loxodonta africana]|uniref:protein VASP homolog n=1 Tax=Loxodonta africana TaxID=9785 RepID=UPI0005405B9E|nr:protein VASP homolog [Loxodonta africana]
MLGRAWERGDRPGSSGSQAWGRRGVKRQPGSPPQAQDPARPPPPPWTPEGVGLRLHKPHPHPSPAASIAASLRERRSAPRAMPHAMPPPRPCPHSGLGARVLGAGAPCCWGAVGALRGEGRSRWARALPADGGGARHVAPHPRAGVPEPRVSPAHTSVWALTADRGVECGPRPRLSGDAAADADPERGAGLGEGALVPAVAVPVPLTPRHRARPPLSSPNLPLRSPSPPPSPLPRRAGSFPLARLRSPRNFSEERLLRKAAKRTKTQRGGEVPQGWPPTAWSPVSTFLVPADKVRGIPRFLQAKPTEPSIPALWGPSLSAALKADGPRDGHTQHGFSLLMLPACDLELQGPSPTDSGPHAGGDGGRSQGPMNSGLFPGPPPAESSTLSRPSSGGAGENFLHTDEGTSRMW